MLCFPLFFFILLRGSLATLSHFTYKVLLGHGCQNFLQPRQLVGMVEVTHVPSCCMNGILSLLRKDGILAPDYSECPFFMNPRTMAHDSAPTYQLFSFPSLSIYNFLGHCHKYLGNTFIFFCSPEASSASNNIRVYRGLGFPQC